METRRVQGGPSGPDRRRTKPQWGHHWSGGLRDKEGVTSRGDSIWGSKTRAVTRSGTNPGCPELGIHSGVLTGPDHWHQHYPIAKGNNQSPIELHTKDIKHDPSLLPFSVSYDPGSCKTILNNGKTCRVVFDDTFDRSMLRGGPLSGPYRLRQFHLHWGSADDHGSEHTVDGVKFAAELHLVHWNPKYNTFGEALKQPDGIAVVGIFLKIGREKGEFQLLLDALDKVKTKGKDAPFTRFDPSCLFPACRDYWTYHGSFTTPPCEECIVWLLLKEPMTVSSDQMAKLRSLLSSAENEPPPQIRGSIRLSEVEF
ncbi:carbonic anhydrase 3 [Pteropus alecto]|uniref:carbonic anhydrase 3 n=1 Tax=Pteropus alecto TaxID=9402 RepID=UPI000D5338EC|nr:carbonic anhydrase 3 [Pteropus alecto]